MSRLLLIRSSPAAVGGEAQKRWVLAVLCAAQFLLVLDVTVVNIAIPSLSVALDLPAAHAQWAVTAYAVPFGALLLAGGRAGDRWGRRSVLVWGLGLFAGGSAVAAAAGDVSTLLVGRLLQGVAAAAISPSALALLVTVFPAGAPHRRALAAWGAVGASGAAAGVLLGGVLTSVAGWRSIFLIGVPVAVALGLASVRLLPAAAPQVPRRLDTVGALLAMTAAGAALFGAARMPIAGATSTSVLAAFGIAVAAVLLLALRLRWAEDPLVAPQLLRRRTVLTGTSLMAIAAGVLVASFYFTSVLQQDGYGHSPIRTGLEFLPAALATLVGAHAGAQAMTRWGSRTVAVAAMSVALIGASLLAGPQVGGSTVVEVLPGFVLLAAGLGAAFVIANATTMSHVGPGEEGSLAGLSTTAHELGSGFVLAIVIAGTALPGGVLPPGKLQDAYLVLAGFAACGLIVGAVGLRRGDGRGMKAAVGH